MVRHEHLALIYAHLFPNLVPNIDWLVQNDFDGQGAFLVNWNNSETEPIQAEINAAERGALGAHNKALRKIAADNELIARATGSRKFTEAEVADKMPTVDKTDRAAVQAKIDDGTYDTDEKVRGASEWRKPKPTRSI